MPAKKKEPLIRSSAAEYLTYIASVGDESSSIEMRYEDGKNYLSDFDKYILELEESAKIYEQSK